MVRPIREVMCEVQWLTLSEGGRSCPPPFTNIEDEYWGMISLENEVSEHGIKMKMSPGAGCYLMYFSSDQAPHEKLIKGTRFELKEGRRLVARGTIR